MVSVGTGVGCGLQLAEALISPHKNFSFYLERIAKPGEDTGEWLDLTGILQTDCGCWVETRLQQWRQGTTEKATAVTQVRLERQWQRWWQVGQSWTYSKGGAKRICWWLVSVTYERKRSQRWLQCFVLFCFVWGGGSGDCRATERMEFPFIPGLLLFWVIYANYL